MSIPRGALIPLLGAFLLGCTTSGSFTTPEETSATSGSAVISARRDVTHHAFTYAGGVFGTATTNSVYVSDLPGTEVIELVQWSPVTLGPVLDGYLDNRIIRSAGFPSGTPGALDFVVNGTRNATWFRFTGTDAMAKAFDAIGGGPRIYTYSLIDNYFLVATQIPSVAILDGILYTPFPRPARTTFRRPGLTLANDGIINLDIQGAGELGANDNLILISPNTGAQEILLGPGNVTGWTSGAPRLTFGDIFRTPYYPGTTFLYGGAFKPEVGVDPVQVALLAEVTSTEGYPCQVLKSYLGGILQPGDTRYNPNPGPMLTGSAQGAPGGAYAPITVEGGQFSALATAVNPSAQYVQCSIRLYDEPPSFHHRLASGQEYDPFSGYVDMAFGDRDPALLPYFSLVDSAPVKRTYTGLPSFTFPADATGLRSGNTFAIFRAAWSVDYAGRIPAGTRTRVEAQYGEVIPNGGSDLLYGFRPLLAPVTGLTANGADAFRDAVITGDALTLAWTPAAAPAATVNGHAVRYVPDGTTVTLYPCLDANGIKLHNRNALGLWPQYQFVLGDTTQKTLVIPRDLLHPGTPFVVRIRSTFTTGAATGSHEAFIDALSGVITWN